MIVLIFVFPVLIFIFFWKFTSVDGVLKPKKFCPHLGLNSRPRAQHSDVQSQELYHSAIQAPDSLSNDTWASKVDSSTEPSLIDWLGILNPLKFRFSIFDDHDFDHSLTFCLPRYNKSWSQNGSSLLPSLNYFLWMQDNLECDASMFYYLPIYYKYLLQIERKGLLSYFRNGLYLKRR